ncbi:MAG: LysR family transcriptional regulator [Ideonella sp.]|nr:MAG: LysR family transcriptional regulator [Burkholderiaceae bacterium]MBE7427062.1 LysR family transcriptional regulator [Ideonella sp.]
MNVTLRQLRAFVAVARAGSFTLAAEGLFVTQSALSGLMREFEQTLGLRLIDRSTRRMQLSDVGRDLLPLVEKILHDLDGALNEAANLKALKRGTVRVAAPQLMSCTLLPEVIAAFAAQHPGVRIGLVDSPVENVAARVLSGEVDLGIGPERDPNPHVEATTLFELPFMAVMPADHALARRASLRWRDLAASPLISLGGPFAERLAADLHGAARDFTVEAKVSFMSTALAMASAGLGITVCIPYAGSLVRLYGLVMRPLVDPVVTRRFFVLNRSDRSLSPAAQAFRGFLIGEIEQRTGAWTRPPRGRDAKAPRRHAA